VGEHQKVAVGDPVSDLLAPDLGLLLVGEQDDHHVAAAGGVGDVEDLEPFALGVRSARRIRAEPDDDVDARLLQVERVSMTLGAIPEDRDGLPLQNGEVGVLVVEHLVAGHAAADGTDRPAIAERPVRSAPARRGRRAGACPTRFGAGSRRSRSASGP
jgi:hypothetical protein